MRPELLKSKLDEPGMALPISIETISQEALKRLFWCGTSGCLGFGMMAAWIRMVYG
jgi:hypothetical protein